MMDSRCLDFEFGYEFVSWGIEKSLEDSIHLDGWI
jgi:hypothetical protein